MKLIAIQCVECKDIVFSRSRHDMRFCSCGESAIDGGPHRANYAIDKLKNTGSYIKVSGAAPRMITIEVDLEMHDLIEDYNSGSGELGLIKADRPPKYFKGISADVAHSS
jgi:hypothetical protein